VRGKAFWAAVVVGWAAIGFGVWGVLADAEQTRPLRWARWFFGSLIVHDLLFAPVICLGGALLSRRLPGWVRAPVQAGLIVGGVLTLIAVPLIRGYGMRPLNPSLHPRNYAVGLAVVLAVVAGVTVLECVRRAVSRAAARGRSPASRPRT